MQYYTKLFILISVLVFFKINLSAQQQYSIKGELYWSKSNVLLNPLTEEYVDIYSIKNGSSSIKYPEIPIYKTKIKIKGDASVSTSIDILEEEEIILKREDSKTKISNKVDINITIAKERQDYYAHLSFIPIYQNNGKYYRLNRFKINLTAKEKSSSAKKDPNNKLNSILASGDIYQFRISTDGIHYIDRALLESALGSKIDEINPKNISIFGNPGAKLPQAIVDDRIDDLAEIPIFIIGEEDNSFDENDRIVFYAQGASTWQIDNNDLIYNQNIYDLHNYIYIKLDQADAKRIEDFDYSQNTSNYSTDSYDHYTRYEEDRTNLLGQFSATEGSGQSWYGPSFNIEREQNFRDKLLIKNIVSGEEADISCLFAGRSDLASSFSLSIENNSWSRIIPRVNTAGFVSRYAFDRTIEESFILNNDEPDVIINYPNNAEGAEGWLDYIQLVYRRQLIYNNDALVFQDLLAANATVAQFNISQVSDATVWDVSDLNNPRSLKTENTATGIKVQDVQNGNLKRYLVFKEEDIVLKPQFVSKVDNQNLHAITDVDMIVVYHKDFATAVERLAEFRRNHDGLNVITVDIEHIYHEFSSGRVDPSALRDFAKMIYNRTDNFTYLLLFGDGSYDYRAIVPGLTDQNFVPVYETVESLDPIEAFPTDDYFSLLSDQEGGNLRGALDIAVGRIPVTTASGAEAVVDKIIHYQSDLNTLGEWRLKTQFIADDEDGNLHLRQTENIARDTEEDHKLYNQSKIYLDAYPQNSTPGGERYPEANAAINSNINNGYLVTNYLGHGGPTGWAQERVYGNNDILNHNNYDQLTLFVTATCSFTGYDDPEIISAGENCLLNPNGAGIGLFSTTRAVWSNENERLAQSVFDTIFVREEGKYQTLGEILRKAKNNEGADTISRNARKFAMIGDPALTLNYPKYTVQLDEINGQGISQVLDTLAALQKVTMSGTITDYTGTVISDFNGILSPTIYDKKSSINTLKNDERSQLTSFEVFKNIIFKGNVSIINGQWEFSFIVPKDIDYSYGTGRASFYAVDGNGVDAGGYSEDFIIGGTFGQAIVDNQGPEIELFIDNESFVSGDQTSPDPLLIIKLSDENGINVSGTSIGHDLTAVLNDPDQSSNILNEFYESNLDDYTAGKVNFRYNDLPLGSYSLTVKAFDVANNSSQETIDFVVINQGDQPLSNVLNYPNPFTTQTKFTFEHDFAESSVDVLVNVFTISGKLVRSINTNSISRGNYVDDIIWDGKDDFGNQLAKGVYLYKVKAKGISSESTQESDFEKLVILK